MLRRMALSKEGSVGGGFYALSDEGHVLPQDGCCRCQMKGICHFCQGWVLSVGMCMVNNASFKSGVHTCVMHASTCVVFSGCTCVGDAHGSCVHVHNAPVAPWLCLRCTVVMPALRYACDAPVFQSALCPRCTCSIEVDREMG